MAVKGVIYMTMKVKDLIEELQKHDQDLEVVTDESRWLEIESVKKDDNDGSQQPVIVIC
jgi:hypothetical protein